MSYQPAVSIVIPAYNEEKIILSVVERALAQDYPNFEVIVANNASTDKTAEILSSISDPRLKVVFESRKGLLFAREAGRVAATGEIIAQLDADCVPERDWVSRAVPFFTNENVVLVTGPYDYYDGSALLRYGTLYTQILFLPLINFIAKNTHQGGAMLGGNTFIRTSALADAGGYNTDLVFYGEDSDTISRVSKFGKVIFSNRLAVKTSARRYQADGFFRIQLTYLQNVSPLVRRLVTAKSKKEVTHPR